MRYSPTIAACNAVPQPASTMRSMSRNSPGVISRPPSLAVASSSESRPAHRVVDGLGLLEDFLEHVMGEVALIDVLLAELDLADLVARSCLRASEVISKPSRSRQAMS